MDDIPADQYIIEHLGENIYTSFFEPLLKSKFGEQRKEVSAAWLMSRIAIRSNRGVSGEHLGYLNGGFHLLIDALEQSIERNGGKIRKQQPVSSIIHENGSWEINGIHYDAIISTIPPQELEKAGGPAMQPIPYQGAACMTLAMDREVTQGIYWLNMKDAAPYGAVVTHTNFIPLSVMVNISCTWHPTFPVQFHAHLTVVCLMISATGFLLLQQRSIGIKWQ